MIVINSYDIVGIGVKEYWKQNYPQDVVAFFWQKYDFEKSWEWCEELVECYSIDNYDSMTFLNDFCEGQTCVKGLTIVPLGEITSFYAEKTGLKRKE